MRGKIQKTENGWIVRYEDILQLHPITQYGMKELPLHPYDVRQIEEDAKRFDNIEARIAAYSDVVFEVVILDAGDNGVRYAKLYTNNQSEKDEQKRLITEIMEADAKDGLYETPDGYPELEGTMAICDSIISEREARLNHINSDTEYNIAAYWFGRGVNAGRNNMIKELQPKRKQ